jgi:hypothetical protein
MLKHLFQFLLLFLLLPAVVLRLREADQHDDGKDPCIRPRRILPRLPRTLPKHGKKHNTTIGYFETRIYKSLSGTGLRYEANEKGVSPNMAAR